MQDLKNIIMISSLWKIRTAIDAVKMVCWIHLREASVSLLLIQFLFPLAMGQGLVQPIPAKAPTPKDNPQTKEKIELGKMLYFDPRLSYDGTVSCNTCHNVMAGGEDGRSVSVGVNGHKGGRGAPTVWNSAFLSVQFWDGREPSLEAQAKGPMINPIEMGNKDHKLVIDRLKKIPGYVNEFKKVFKVF